MDTKVTSAVVRELVAIREIKTGRVRVRQRVSYGGHSKTLILQPDGSFKENGSMTIDDMLDQNPKDYEPIYTGDTLHIQF